MTVDYLVVGSGLTGGTIARKLADAGREVLMVDRRPHAGGNVNDFAHESGVRIHTYGPHYFRTNSEELWRFVNQLSPFYRFEAVLKTEVDGKLENWPVAASYVRKTVGDAWEPQFKGTASNFEEASLSLMPRIIYEKFVRGYTEKQWGVAAASLSAGLANRFDVREDDEPRLMRHLYQGIPVQGYAHWMSCLLKGIPLILNWDFLARREEIKVRKCLVFTGPIDEFFGFDLGRLRYRGQRREHSYFPDQGFIQPVVQVNNPDPGNGPHIRTIEWKHAMPPEYASRIQGTVLTKEIPFTPDDPQHFEYPFPDQANVAQYGLYRRRAEESGGRLLICGRLGEYRYYDMDQAIARALMLAVKLLNDAAP